jgi:4-hydroxythreonine-4-phosphate dehydrogenase
MVTDGVPGPRLAVSMGDPVGVGPEVVVGALLGPERPPGAVVVYGDPGALRDAARCLESDARIVEVDDAEAPACADPAVIAVRPVSRLEPGERVPAAPSPGSDRAQLAYIHAALGAVRAGRCDAIVTAPIHKAAIHRAGAPWPGHTEMLAELVSPPHGPPCRPLMMLAGPRLRVVPLTTHCALSEVPSKITPERVHQALRVMHEALVERFGVARPRLAVAGLNPHAGDGGLFGDEEARLIEPGLALARAEGIDVSGPHPGDTVFRTALGGAFDAVLGMYHDQALIPVKLLDFERTVNVTLGLPIIRTSVDHGTAYDIAGTGRARPQSMAAALGLAARLVRGVG